jgi:hypothetical protein
VEASEGCLSPVLQLFICPRKCSNALKFPFARQEFHFQQQNDGCFFDPNNRGLQADNATKNQAFKTKYENIRKNPLT